MCGRDPRLREPALQQQGTQQPGIGAVSFGALLGTPRRRGLGRIPQMRHHTDGRQLLAHVTPPGAALKRELRVPIRAVLAKPAAQRSSCRRADLTPLHQPVVVYVFKGDLLSMHVQTAYDGHRDLLELLKHFSDAPYQRASAPRGSPSHVIFFLLAARTLACSLAPVPS